MTLAPPTDHRFIVDTSITIISSLQRPSGAYPASPEFSAYTGYSWFRDGAFIADGMSAAGQVDSASRFFDWCSGILSRYRPTVTEIVGRAGGANAMAGEHMMPARFHFDGTVGAEEWGNFQLDGYGTWVWSVLAHATRHTLSVEPWADAIVTSCEYLASSWNRACWDWWEEHPERLHVSTLGCVGAGLEAGIASGLLSPALADASAEAVRGIRQLIDERGTHDGHLVKWLDDPAVDASNLAIIAPLGFIDPSTELAARTIEAVRYQLEVDGGLHRFTDDTFFGGGRWPLLTCFLGLCLFERGDVPGAHRALDWAAATALPDGRLPEQVGGHLLHPEFEQFWIDKWGPVATPLLWSHAMFLRLEAELATHDAEAQS
ncbi:glycoside hydrolase family 15 protein [Cryobacterium sp. Y50]|uniref:glycoside hydrolase family 15 protein n=1 Tax=Cryobacterium sp. Y50 TaxID=2048286 RepID=UPI000CE2FCD8|nr:glycoside hydrolase family 15 protein [Cryobacterium sp. Y50]